jgi:hypothetical protein
MFMQNTSASQRHNSWGPVRSAIHRIIATGLLTVLLMVGSEARAWNSTDMTGVLPSLDLTMTRASDG